MPEETQEAVRKFLRAFKKIAKEHGIYFVPREGFIETLGWLGYTKANCCEEILGLTVPPVKASPAFPFQR